MNRKDELLDTVISLCQEWTETANSILSPRIHCRGRGIPDGKYYLHISHISAVNIMIQEFVLSPSGEHILFRLWTLQKERRWTVLSLEKNKNPVYLRDVVLEMEDLVRRMILLQRVMTPRGLYFAEEVHGLAKELELPVVPLKPYGLKALLSKMRKLFLQPTIFMPLVGGAVFILAIIAVVYAVNLGRIKGEIDGSIDGYISRLQGELQNLNSFREEAQSDLTALKGKLAQEEADFIFNRRNAYVNVLRLSEELTKFLPARKEAYRLIADTITDAVSYGEIIYEMSRLPTAEFQARIFLATDRRKVVPLGRLEPVFETMAYPLELPNEENNGLGFRITDGYMEKRADPLGSGGISPHFAVDIINVANISLINYAGAIIRDGNPAGKIVSVAEGMVRQTGFDPRYGWYIEVEHPLSREVKTAYPGATAWSSYYAHMAEASELSAGTWVTQRQQLGDIGNTGRSTGPHLHFETRVYQAKGAYRSFDGKSFDKINPYP